ncbi:16S rRNA (adenine(1518)-N(6)/adenine(1519)-N(6)) -dimethyltransferase RsmA [Hydrogenobaculum acidophilum]
MLKPKKSFGQNFLKSKNIANSIVELLDVKEDDTLIEIGPGLGALTEFLYQKPKKELILVELDKDIFKLLEETYKNAKLLNIDASKLDLSIYEKAKVIGNLPYNMYANILINMVNQEEHISKMVFMLQKEVGERLISNSKDKSWLWAYVNTYFEVSYAFSVPGRFFNPVPKVVSGVVVFDKKPKTPRLDKEDYKVFLKKIFANKRKMLKQKLDVDEKYAKKRVDELSIEEILDIYSTFSCLSKNAFTSTPAL